MPSSDDEHESSESEPLLTGPTADTIVAVGVAVVTDVDRLIKSMQAVLSNQAVYPVHETVFVAFVHQDLQRHDAADEGPSIDAVESFITTTKPRMRADNGFSRHRPGRRSADNTNAYYWCSTKNAPEVRCAAIGYRVRVH